MDKWIVSFITASFSALCWTELPAISIIVCLYVTSVLLLYPLKFPLLSGFLAGLAWLASVGHWTLSWQLPEQLIRQSVWIEGQVQNLVLHQDDRAKLTLKLVRFNDQPIDYKAPSVRLSWYQPGLTLSQNQTLRLKVRLKPAHGLANDTHFKYQQWLFTQGIRATGYVVKHCENQVLADPGSWRQQLVSFFRTAPLQNRQWLAAMSFGYRGFMQDSDWQLAQQTGISHLIAISGLHLGIITALSHWLLARILVRGAKQSVNAFRMAMYMALPVVGFYAFLAGFSLPTIRALIAVFIIAWLFYRGAHIGALRLILYSVFIIVLFMPLSLFSISFWLSFSAVLFIVFIFWRWPLASSQPSWRDKLWMVCRIQLLLSLLMMPLVAWQFGLVSVASPLVNLIAVPLVTIVLVPVCLLAMLLLPLSTTAAIWVLTVADVILNFFLSGLVWINQWSMSAFSVSAMTIEIWVLAFLAIFIAMLPRFSFQYGLSLVCLSPLLVSQFAHDNSAWRVDVLDIGHGLSVVVESNGQFLVYDVGPSYPSGFNIGESVLLPVLHRRGAHRLDYLFISHHDGDHDGSLPQIQERLQIEQLVGVEVPCVLGDSWQWQGLDIRVLWPSHDNLFEDDNNRSCVISIGDGDHQVLLTGDIEQAAEKQLVSLHSESTLRSRVLIAPHHGSNTSSSEQLITSVSPDWVVFSQAFYNRWQFPDKRVIERYQRHDVNMLSTSETGQVSIIFSPSGYEVITFREDIYPWWYANN